MSRKEPFRYTEDACFSNGKYCPGLISHFIEMHSEFYNSQSIATGEQTHIDHSSKTLGFRYKCWAHFTGPTRIISEPITQKLGFCRWRELKRKKAHDLQQNGHSSLFRTWVWMFSKDQELWPIWWLWLLQAQPHPMAPVLVHTGTTYWFTSLFNLNICKCLPNHGDMGNNDTADRNKLSLGTGWASRSISCICMLTSMCGQSQDTGISFPLTQMMLYSDMSLEACPLLILPGFLAAIP